MLKSERRSLIRFLAIYLSSTFLLFLGGSWVFYIAAKYHLIQQQKESIKYETSHIKSKLRELHSSSADKLIYPTGKIFKSAIYDLDKKYIFGDLKGDIKSITNDEKNLCYLEKVEPYYLGSAYLLVCKKMDFEPIFELQRNILLFLLGAGVFFTILGYFLGRLFIAPMRESIQKMNRFIQDATHELNTPISTILTNIEMIETFGELQNCNKELKRIEIASKTLSRIYGDLVYLNLNHKYHQEIVHLDISKLIKERLDYFWAMIEAKELNLKSEIKDNVILRIDRNDAIRLIDNLLSNAIKYNKTGGLLHVKLKENFLMIKDSGIGIKRSELKNILHRFKRANESEGGFGIGLDIVNQIVRNYNLSLEIDSKENEGTKVVISW